MLEEEFGIDSTYGRSVITTVRYNQTVDYSSKQVKTIKDEIDLSFLSIMAVIWLEMEVMNCRKVIIYFGLDYCCFAENY